MGRVVLALALMTAVGCMHCSPEPVAAPPTIEPLGEHVMAGQPDMVVLSLMVKMEVRTPTIATR